MKTEPICDECGAVLPANAPQGLCPKCLLGMQVKPGSPDQLDAAGDTARQPRTINVALPVQENPGTVIGRYRLLEKIGEGGFGVVYMAEQQEPVQRKVALKIIKAGMDTKEVIARFEAERQALALMDHPNIAKVLDAGTTDNGRPYFVMELVRGIPITDYCDQSNLTTRERLQLFTKVCQAVQHAHQKGIIHRDIKPSNVLVTEHDGEPVPKVIDFGVAKALGQKLTEKTLFTGFQHMIGTPAYMSPEQAALGGLDIDTRADIYSLGVLLYELLTGVTPLDADTFRKAALDEIRRMIRETDPPKPSTRLQTLGDKLTEVARQRRTEPAALSRLVRGDLDWIVMKCLEKDRQRRYETANGLATDLTRHLKSEPVVARPPTRFYRFHKMVRRNKLAFAASGAVGASLIFGFAISTWLFVKERSARQRAVAAEQAQARSRHEAEAARVSEAAQRQQAEDARANEAGLRQQAQIDENKAKTEAAKSQQVAQFLKEMLQGVGPSVALGRDATMLREVLEKIAERVGGTLQDQPLVEAELRNIIGRVYWEIGQFGKAEAMHRESLRLYRRIVGEESLETADSLTLLASTLSQQARFVEAETKIREALAIRRKVLGTENPAVAESLFDLAHLLYQGGKRAESEGMDREALAIRRKLLGDDSLAVSESLNNLSLVVGDLGRLDEAEAMLRESLAINKKALRDDNLNRAMTLYNLGELLQRQNRLAEAEKMHREALAIRRKLLGDEHRDVPISIYHLALVLRSEGKLDEVEPLLNEALVVQRRVWRKDPGQWRYYGSGVVDILLNERKYDEAEGLLNEFLTPAEETQPGSAHLLAVRAGFSARRGRWKEAAADVAKAIELQPTNHLLYHAIAPLLVASGDLDDYRQHCLKVLAHFGATTDPLVGQLMAKACLIQPCPGVDLEAVGKLADVSITASPSRPFYAWFQFAKGLCEYRQGHFASAAEWMAKALTKPGEISYGDMDAYAVLAMAQWRLGQDVVARATLARAIEIERTRLPKLESVGPGAAWIDWLTTRALLHEAKALIEGGSRASDEAKESEALPVKEAR